MHPKNLVDQKRRGLVLSSALSGLTVSLTACGGADSSDTASATPAPAPSPSPAPVAGSPPAAPRPSPTPSALPAPAWAAALQADTWTALPGTAFLPWARANIPAGRYQGTGPLEAIVNAFCDPANDVAQGAQYFYGGGHGDGSCNAVCKFDHQTLRWSLAGLPTPPSKYPPSYVNGGSGQPGPLVYPSGLRSNDGFFYDASVLTDPRDAPYATPLARASTHMYAAAAMRGSVAHYFYLSYAEFDTATGRWTGRGVNLGQQLADLRPQQNTNQLFAPGTVALYDEVTDRFFVTLCPGDNGGGFRNAIIVFNPVTRKIESIHDANGFGPILDSINICRVGRDLYCFTKIGNYGQPQVMNQGFIFNLDNKSFRRFVLTGDTQASTYIPSATQETIPSFYDGVAIRRWNFQAVDRNKILSVNPVPLSGTGSLADPFVLRQTERVIGGAAPARPLFVYTRLMYHSGARCALLIPEANADWMALKLS